MSTQGPEEWAKLYALETSGKRQSPIDLKSDVVEVVGKDSKLSTLMFKYPSEMVDLELNNAGSSWKVDIPSVYSDYTCKISRLSFRHLERITPNYVIE
jgi:carbonic anhydrase